MRCANAHANTCIMLNHNALKSKEILQRMEKGLYSYRLAGNIGGDQGLWPESQVQASLPEIFFC